MRHGFFHQLGHHGNVFWCWRFVGCTALTHDECPKRAVGNLCSNINDAFL
jgi:hypothetical protein